MPARTLADLTSVASAADVRRATRTAEKRGLPLDPRYLAERTESDLERDFLAICRRHRAPEPETHVRIGRYRVDFLWPDERLVVEVDGYIYHRGRRAMREDNDRDLESGAGRVQASCGLEDTRIDERSGGLGGGRALPSAGRAHKIEAMAKQDQNGGGEELFLIDGNSLAYRAFFALPESIATADGRPTNAIYGFASMMVKILDRASGRRP